MNHTPPCEDGCTSFLYDEEGVQCECPCHNTQGAGEMSRTPGPWTYCKEQFGYCVFAPIPTEDGTGTVTDVPNNEADARLIVQACNSHEQLLEALRELLEIEHRYRLNPWDEANNLIAAEEKAAAAIKAAEEA